MAHGFNTDDRDKMIKLKRNPCLSGQIREPMETSWGVNGASKNF